MACLVLTLLLGPNIMEEKHFRLLLWDEYDEGKHSDFLF
jgi:hypothetical protein